MAGILPRARNTVARMLAFGASVLADPSDHRAVESPPPASFPRWVAWRNNRLRGNKPNMRLKAEPETGSPRVAVVMHVYFDELVPQLLESLKSIPVPFDMIVTNATGRPLPMDVSELAHLSDFVVLDVENRGRDIRPLIASRQRGTCSIRTSSCSRCTRRRASGARRTRRSKAPAPRGATRFLDALIGSEATVERHPRRHSRRIPRLGIVTADGNILGSDYWGGDRARTRHPSCGVSTDARSRRAALPRGLDVLDPRRSCSRGSGRSTSARTTSRPRPGRSTAPPRMRSSGRSAFWPPKRGTGSPSALDRLRRLREPCRTVRGEVRASRARSPFYLPQFHPIRRERPLVGRRVHGVDERHRGDNRVYHGHQQPLLPGDLGLLRPRARRCPAAAARPRRVRRHRGLHVLLLLVRGPPRSGRCRSQRAARRATSTQPFCIMWANENWTRRWDGSERRHPHRPGLRPGAGDGVHRGRPRRSCATPGTCGSMAQPVIAIYRLDSVPDFAAVIAHWRERAPRRRGRRALRSHRRRRDADGRRRGRAAGHGSTARSSSRRTTSRGRRSCATPARRQPLRGKHPQLRGDGRDAELALLATGRRAPLPGRHGDFDNTARRQWEPDLWYGANPYTFRRWLDAASRPSPIEVEPPLVFVNAWNEWAEGRRPGTVAAVREHLPCWQREMSRVDERAHVADEFEHRCGIPHRGWDP